MKAEYLLQRVSKKQNKFYGNTASAISYISLQMRECFEIALKFFYPFPNFSKLFLQRNNRYPIDLLNLKQAFFSVLERELD